MSSSPQVLIQKQLLEVAQVLQVLRVNTDVSKELCHHRSAFGEQYGFHE